MANAVDERIVAAKFDSSQFEKGVDRTIKKLDELEEKLDMTDVGKNMEESSKKTEKATESLANSVEKLEDRFTSFFGMLKQKTLEKIADGVVNAFFRIEKATLGFFNNMTIGQMSAGMDKYESMLKSVRMITNASYFASEEDRKAGKRTYYKQEEAQASITALQAYADETSYSMDQMTDAMSKMVAAGVDLKQAEKNVQGIANACANAGINATDAARAFFNLSQAYGTGALKYTDYRSLELLNMTDESFQNNLLAAGVAAGVLEEKKDKNGNITYKTKKTAKNGKVTAGKSFTRQGLGESLKYGWADKDVMDALFGDQYYVDVEDFKASRGDGRNTAEARIKFLTSLTDESKIAARATDKEVEAIIKSLDAEDDRRKKYATLRTTKEKQAYLKEMRSDADISEKLINKEMERIVKGLDETDRRRQKFESLTTEDERAAYLKELRENAEVNADIIDKLPKKYSEAAAKAFMAAREARSFKDVINAIGDYVSSKFSQTFTILFGQLDKAAEFFTALSESGIALMFQNIADYVLEVTEAFDSNGGGKGGDTFRELILGINNAIGMLADTIGLFMPDVDSLGETLYEIAGDLSVAVQHLQIYISQLQAWLLQGDAAGSRLDKLRRALNNISGVFMIVGKLVGVAFTAIRRGLDLLTPVFDLVINLLAEITQPIGDLGNRENMEPFNKITNAIENVYNVLKPLAELLDPVFSTIGKILGQVGAFLLQGSIDGIIMNFEFIGDLIKFIVDLFGPDATRSLMRGNDVLGDIISTIDQFKAICSSAFGAVSQFFSTLISDLRKMAGLEEGEPGGIFEGLKNFFDTNEFIVNAKAWFEQAKSDIRSWFESLPTRLNEFVAKLLTPKVDAPTEGDEADLGLGDRLRIWFEGVITSAKDFILSLPERIKNAAIQLGDTLKNFIHNLFYKKITVWEVDERGVKANATQVEVETPIKIWFDKFVDSVKEFIKSIPGRVRTLASNLSKAVSKFIHGLLYKSISVKEVDEKGKSSIKKVEVPTVLKKWLDGLVNGIKLFIKNIPEYIKTAIRSVGSITRSIIDAIKGFFSASDVEGAAEDEATKISFEGVINALKDVLKTLINEIFSLFTGTDDIEANFEWFEEKVVSFVRGVPRAIATGIDTVTFAFGNIWEWLYDKLVGGDTEGTNSRLLKYIEDNFGENAKEDDNTILGKIKHLPNLIYETFRDASTILGSMWDNLLGMQIGTKQGKIIGVNEMGSPIFEQVPLTVQDKLNELTGKITSFISNLPKNITKAWQSISGSLSDAWQKVMAMEIGTKEDGTTPMTVQDKLNEIKDNVINFIINLPGEINAAWEFIKTSLSNAWSNIMNMGTGTKDGRYIGMHDGKPVYEQIPITVGDRIESIKQTIIRFIENLPEEIQKAWEGIQGKFSEVWNNIMSLQVGTKNGKYMGSKFDKNGKWVAVYEQVPLTLKEALDNFVENLPEMLTGVIDIAREKFGDFWNNLVAIFTGDETADTESIGGKISKVLADLPVWLAEGLESAAISIQSVFDSLSGMMQDSIDRATTESIDPSEALAERTEDNLSDDSNQNRFLKAISGFGQKLWDIITKTIPGFISKGFEWVSTNWETTWKPSLLGLFQNLTGIDPNEIDLGTIGEAIKNAIHNLPTIIANAFNDVKTFITNLFNKGTGVEEGAENVMDDAADGIEETAENSSIWTTIADIGGRIGTALSGALGGAFGTIGPMLIDTVSTGLQNLGSIVGIISNLLLGNNIEGDVNEMMGDAEPEAKDAMVTSLTRLGQTIKDTILKVIPRFIGSALGSLVYNIPAMIGEFFSAFTEAWNNEATIAAQNAGTNRVQDDASALTNILGGNLTDIIKRVLGGLDSIVQMFTEKQEDGSMKLNGLGYTVLIIGALLLVINMIADMVVKFRGIEEESEKTAQLQSKNSFGGVMRKFLEAMEVVIIIAAFVGTLDEEHYNRFKETLKTMLDMIKSVMEFYMWFTAISYVIDKGIDITKMFKGIGEDAEDAGDAADDAGDQVNGFMEKLKGGAGDLMDSTFGTLKSTIKAGGLALGMDLVGTATSNIFSQFIGNFAQVGSAINIFNEQLQGVLSSVEQSTRSVDAAIALMGKVGELVGLIVSLATQEGAIESAGSAIYQLTAPFFALTMPFSGDIHATDVVNAIEHLMDITNKMTEFSNFVTGDYSFDIFRQSVISLGNAMAVLSLIKIDNLNNLTDEQIDQVANILRRLLTNNGLMAVITSFTPEKFGSNGANDISQGTELLLMLSSTMSKLASGVSGFTSEQISNVSSFFNDMNRIATSIVETSDANGQIVIVDFAGQMVALGTGLKSFANSIQGISRLNFNTANYVLTSLVTLGKHLDDVGVGLFQKVFSGGTTIEQFATQIGTLGGGLRDFLHSMQFDEVGMAIKMPDMELVVSAMYALNQVAQAASLIDSGNVDTLNSLLNSDNAIGEGIGNFFKSMMTTMHQLGEITEYEETEDKRGWKKISTKTFNLYNNDAIDYLRTVVSIFNNFCDAVSKINIDSTSMDNIASYFMGETYGRSKIGDISNGVMRIFEQFSNFGKYDAPDKAAYKINIETAKTMLDMFVEFLSIFAAITTRMGSSNTINLEDSNLRVSYTTNMTQTAADMISQLTAAMETLSENADKLFDMVDAFGNNKRYNEESLTRAYYVLGLIKELGSVLALFGSGENFDVMDVASLTEAAQIQDQHSDSNLADVVFAAGEAQKGKLAGQSLVPNNYITEGLINMFTFTNSIEPITTAIETFVSSFNEAVNFEENANKLKSIGETMADWVFRGLSNKFATDPLYELTITPVIDEQKLRAQTGQLFNPEEPVIISYSQGIADAVYNALTGHVSATNWSDQYLIQDYSERLSGMDSELMEIRDGIKDLSTAVSGLSEDFNGAQVIIDDDRLVGAIGPKVDAWLAEVGRLYINHVSTR